MNSWSVTATALAIAGHIGTPSLFSQARPVSTSPKPGTVLITAALVDRDMQVRPVPLHGLALTGSATNSFATRTAIDGKASVVVPPGTYTIASVAPIEFQGQRYPMSFTATGSVSCPPPTG